MVNGKWGGGNTETSFRTNARKYQGNINPQTKTSIQIAQFLKDRNITKLLHFTDKSNLDNILNFGLLSREILNNIKAQYSFNDAVRYDNRLDCISLSISRINKKLLDSFIEKEKIKECVIIEIDANMLYREDNERIYCQTNAATTNSGKGSKFQNLMAMFDDEVIYYTNYDGVLREKIFKRNTQNISNNMPTAPQAEILWKDWINPNYISGWCHYDGRCYKIEEREVEHRERYYGLPSYMEDAGFDYDTYGIAGLTDDEREYVGYQTRVTKSIIKEKIYIDEYLL